MDLRVSGSTGTPVDPSARSPGGTGEVPPPAARVGHPLLHGRVATAVAVVAFAAVGVATFVLIHRYAADVLLSDQWSDVDLLRHAHDGNLSFGLMWAQHNENRILVPNLVVLGLGYTTHLQVLVEDYLGGVALCGWTALVILTHRRRSAGVPLVAYVPVALVLLSFAVSTDALYGFNLSWCLVLLAVGACLYLVDRPELTGWALAGAVAAAVLGSFSSLQGLFVWPTVLVLLWLRRRSTTTLVVWAVAAVATVTVYLLGFDTALAGSGTPLGPAATLRFTVAELGNVIGAQMTSSDDLVIGVCVLGVALLALVVGVRRDRQDGGAVGVALILYGFVFVVSAGLGRADLGLLTALRYAPFVLDVWVGSYFVLLSRLLAPAPAVVVPGVGGNGDGPAGPWPRRLRALVTVTFVGLLAAMLLQAVVADRQGVGDAGGWHTEELDAANVEVNLSAAPDIAVEAELGEDPVPYIRSMAAYARSARLSVFDTPLAAAEARAGLESQFLVEVLRPLAGERLRGTVVLDAGVQAPHPTGVTFRVDGWKVPPTTVAHGSLTAVGWVTSWDTRRIRNGYYELEARATAGGRVFVSAPIRVRVVNPG